MFHYHDLSKNIPFLFRGRFSQTFSVRFDVERHSKLFCEYFAIFPRHIFAKFVKKYNKSSKPGGGRRFHGVCSGRGFLNADVTMPAVVKLSTICVIYSLSSPILAVVLSLRNPQIRFSSTRVFFYVPLMMGSWNHDLRRRQSRIGHFRF